MEVVSREGVAGCLIEEGILYNFVDVSQAPVTGIRLQAVVVVVVRSIVLMISTS